MTVLFQCCHFLIGMIFYSCSTISSFSSVRRMRKRRMAKSPAMQATQATLLQGSSWLKMKWRVIATVSTYKMLAGVVSMSIRTNSRPTTMVSTLCRYVLLSAK